LQKTPPELAAYIIDKGIVLTGGSSLLRNIDQLIARTTGVLPLSPTTPCLRRQGTGIALDNLDSFKPSILATK
jgi:rod shape-determining protein MreB